MELKGKIVAFLGDSITQGAGLMDDVDYRYDKILMRECEFSKIYNHGLGGTRIAYQFLPSVVCPKNDLNFCGRAYFIEDDADIIVIFGGINDYLFGDAPFGNIGDTTIETFCGAVYYLVTYLKNKHPNAQIVFLTPTHTSYRGYDDQLPSPSPKKKPCAKPLIGYVQAIKDVCGMLDVPVLDMYHDFGIDPRKESDKNQYAPDGLHLNKNGHIALAAKVKEFLMAL